MDALCYTDARRQLGRLMDRVCDDCNPLIVTRSNGRSVVILSLEDYEALEETAYLLRSPANAARMAESLAQANRK